MYMCVWLIMYECVYVWFDSEYATCMYAKRFNVSAILNWCGSVKRREDRLQKMQENVNWKLFGYDVDLQIVSLFRYRRPLFWLPICSLRRKTTLFRDFLSQLKPNYFSVQSYMQFNQKQLSSHRNNPHKTNVSLTKYALFNELCTVNSQIDTETHIYIDIWITLHCRIIIWIEMKCAVST